jgi:hypothetical protein
MNNKNKITLYFLIYFFQTHDVSSTKKPNVRNRIQLNKKICTL